MAKVHKILIVEDDDLLRESLKGIIEWENHVVDAAPEGQSALEMLRAMDQLPDIIFLDLNMPRMSGHEFLKHQKLETPAIAAIPVVVMTAVPDVQVSGVAALMRKPMDFDDIVGRLNALLEQTASRQTDSRLQS